MGKAMSPPLPKWRPRRTLIDLYNEKDHTPWYWRGAATLSAFFIMIGFLIFPAAFKPNPSLTITSQSSTIAAIILIALGYTISIVVSLTCTSWIFRLDILFGPCLISSLLGLINTLYSLSIHSVSPQWTAPSIAALALSVISTLTYTIAALLTFRKIHIVRARDAMHRYHPDSSADKMMPDTDLQRQQLLRLLLQQEDVKKASPEGSQQTFKIDWPGSNGERRSTLGTLRNWRGSRNGGERSSWLYNSQDNAPQPPMPMEVVAEEETMDLRIAPLEARAYVPPSKYDDGNVPGIINTRSYIPPQPRVSPISQHLPQLQENGYPIEKPDAHQYMREQSSPHRDQYRMVDPNEIPRSVSRASMQDRESRRTEIELSDRGWGKDEGMLRQDLEGVEVIGSIRRVETDGWGRR